MTIVKLNIYKFKETERIRYSMNTDLIKRHKFIVFGFEHYNPLGIVRSLGEEGIYPIGIILKQKKKITSASKYIKELYMVDSIDEGYRLIVNKFGSEEEKPFLLTSDDTITSYLDMRYDELKDKFIFYNAGMQGRVSCYMKKGLLCMLAEKYELKIPKTYHAKTGVIPEDIKYPVITKAQDSIQFGWKENVYICNSDEELKQAFKKIKQPEIIIQQYIEKENELCLDGMSINGGNNVFVTMASSYNYQLPQSYSFMFTLKNFNDYKIQHALEGMMSEIGFNGIFTMEFLEGKDGELYFIEINFRHSAWGYASTCLGMNLLTNWAFGMITGDFPKDIYKEIPENYMAMVELPDFKNRVLSGIMSPFKWFKELKSCSCLYYSNKKDPKPFWSAIFSTIIH